MNYFSALLVSILFVNISFSQFLENYSIYEQYGITKNELMGQHKKNINLEAVNNQYKYTGSPYFTADFVLGDLILNGKNIGKYLIRYNIFGEEIQVKDTENSHFSLLKSTSLEVVTKSFLIRAYDYNTKDAIENGYFMVLVDDEKCSLLLKKEKKFIPPVKAKTSFHTDAEAKFTDLEDYYIKFETGLPVKFKLKTKKFINLFPVGKRAEIKNYISTNTIDIKKQGDLIKVVNYYNSLGS